MGAMRAATPNRSKGAEMSFSEDPTQGGGTAPGEDPAGTRIPDSSEDPTRSAPGGERPDEDPVQGSEVGEQPDEDPTQGDERSSLPDEDPTGAGA